MTRSIIDQGWVEAYEAERDRLARDGGYPPLMLDNVDFAALYLQKLEQLREEKRQKEQPN